VHPTSVQLQPARTAHVHCTQAYPSLSLRLALSASRVDPCSRAELHRRVGLLWRDTSEAEPGNSCLPARLLSFSCPSTLLLLLHFYRSVRRSYPHLLQLSVLRAIRQQGRRKTPKTKDTITWTVAHIDKATSELATSTLRDIESEPRRIYTMVSRLAFMDLSVDLKTLIVQHVSLWVHGRIHGSRRKTRLTLHNTDQPPNRPQKRLPHLQTTPRDCRPTTLLRSYPRRRFAARHAPRSLPQPQEHRPTTCPEAGSLSRRCPG
jgi:hypothetical protein